jgi:hypothetical protein
MVAPSSRVTPGVVIGWACTKGRLCVRVPVAPVHGWHGMALRARVGVTYMIKVTSVVSRVHSLGYKVVGRVELMPGRGRDVTGRSMSFVMKSLVFFALRFFKAFRLQPLSFVATHRRTRCKCRRLD